MESTQEAQVTGMNGVAGGLDRRWRLTVAVGLLVAVGAGIAAEGFESVATQSILFALSSVGWVVATSILAVHHGVRAETLVAAGFLILAVAEMLLWVNGRPGDIGYESGFAGGVIFYVPGVVLASVPARYPRFFRGLGMLAGVCWSVGAARFLTGGEFAHTDPLAIVGYILISAFLLGVGWVTVRDGFSVPRRGVPLASS